MNYRFTELLNHPCVVFPCRLRNGTVLLCDSLYSHWSLFCTQFRYKTRVYKQTNLDEKALAKLSSKVFHLFTKMLLVADIQSPGPPTDCFSLLRPVRRNFWITFRLDHWRKWLKFWKKVLIQIFMTQTVEVRNHLRL